MASPSAPPADAKTVQKLGRVLRYAVPHKALVALSMLLMAFQAAASNARILLLYPIMTRVFGVDESSRLAGTTAESKPAAPADGKPDAPKAAPPKDGAGPADGGTKDDVQVIIRAAQRRAGKLLGPFDQMITGLNGWTREWVPDDWLKGATKGEMTPAETREALDLQRDRFATLWTVLLLFFVFLLVMSLSAYFEDYVNERVRLKILMDVRKDLCGTLLRQPMAFYDTARRGDVVQRVMDDVFSFAVGLKLVLGSLVEGILNLAFGVVILAALSGELTIVCILGMLLFLPLRRFTKKVKKQAQKRQSGSARRVEVLLQIVSGIRTVKAFRAEDRKVAEFAEADRVVYRQSLKVQRAKSGSDALTEFVNNLLVMLLSVGGSFLVLRNVLPIGPAALLLFLSQLSNLYKPAKKLIKDVNGMNDAMASIDRVFEILDLPGPKPDPADAREFPGLRDRVRFERVGFSYAPGQPVLKDISFDIEKGTTVALVGPSGGGKSTICDLLLRFYDPTEGRITVDGTPLAAFRRNAFLDRTAVVTQDPFLFHASIGENIRLGRPGATEAEVAAAAAAASIHDHIASLPNGYESEVGERGARLSGGQRQRITIARALIRDPNLLVLDEATASLDAESERQVQQALDRLREGRTTLVVAHRLATVKRADRIVVLDGGRVVDQGTHEELLARDGLYARLCAMQDLGAPGPVLDDDVPEEDAASAPGTAP